jgi:hypothetical protein
MNIVFYMQLNLSQMRDKAKVTENIQNAIIYLLFTTTL